MSDVQKRFLTKILESGELNQFTEIGEFYNFCETHDLQELKVNRRLDIWFMDVQEKIVHLMLKPTYCDYDRRILNSVREYHMYKDEINGVHI